MSGDAVDSGSRGGKLALQELPDGYEVKRTFDFSKGIWFWIVNILGIPVAFVVGWLVLQLAALLRPEDANTLLRTTRQATSWEVAIILIVSVLVVHELIHGLAFWWFTRSRPKFGFKVYAAYAGAPDWYLPRNQHVLAGLSPLIVITLFGALLLPFVSASQVHLVLWPIAFNGMGAVGDIAVTVYELLQTPNTLVNDTGMKITLYGTD